MSELGDMRDEVELPPYDATCEAIRAYAVTLESGAQYTIASLKGEKECRERQLKAALAANREKDAEIERLDRSEDKLLTERDYYYELAEKLADAISELTGVDLGEHSNLNDPFQNALEAAASLRASGGEKWIDVKQELPLRSRVLVYFPSESTSVMDSLFDGRNFHVDGFIRTKAVTHWMPLPAPPTKDKE